MKIDLHCHSKHSKRPTLWVMQKLGCPESFTDPAMLHTLARERGMTAVTITDHNVIDGALEIAHLPGVTVGCEYTTYFPEDRCKVHVLAYGLTEALHEDLTRARENIHDLAAFLRANSIPHVCAHPFFGVNDRLEISHVEQLVLLFKHWELNGDIAPEMNDAVRRYLDALTPESVAQMADRHGIEPVGPEPWRKHLTTGSDDHSSLHLASSHTHVAGAESFGEFWEGVDQGQARLTLSNASPVQFGRNVYGIAYQFYRNRLDLDRYVTKDTFLRFLDKTLRAKPEGSEPRITWLARMMTRGRSFRGHPGADATLFQTARFEAERMILQDPQLQAILGNGQGDLDGKWFELVSRVSGRVLQQFGERLLERVAGGRFFDLFHGLGSAGALYAMLAPYFVAYSHHAGMRAFSADTLRAAGIDPGDSPPRVAHFTDTFSDVNGVARTLNQQLATARDLGKDYTVVTCFAEKTPPLRGLRQFAPEGVYTLPEYPGLKLLVPPFLQMLAHCHEERYTHLHVSTPGPVGLAALGIARILGLPVTGTYHTAFPQYAKALTEDGYVEGLCWQYMLWFHEQLDAVFVPSRATGAELTDRGVTPANIRLYPRGVDTARFHPSKRCDVLRDRFGLDESMPSALYAGRVSREKNLPALCHAYRALLDDGTRLRLVVAGDGPYRAELEAALAGTPAVFTGFLEGEDLCQLYASCDFLVFPSTTDTFGNVVLEAQASGIPVIVTDKGGPAENMQDGVTGLVVPGNDASALARAMTELADNPGLRARMGAAARTAMEARSFQSAFETLYGMYTSEAAPARPVGIPDPASLLHPFTTGHKAAAS